MIKHSSVGIDAQAAQCFVNLHFNSDGPEGRFREGVREFSRRFAERILFFGDALVVLCDGLGHLGSREGGFLCEGVLRIRFANGAFFNPTPQILLNVALGAFHGCIVADFIDGRCGLGKKCVQ